MIAAQIFIALSHFALCLPCARALQLSGYRPNRGCFEVAFSPYFSAPVAVQTATVFLALFSETAATLFCGGMLTLTAVTQLTVSYRPPLVFTKRMVRLLVVAAVLCILAAIFLPLFAIAPPLIVIVSFGATYPLEIAVNSYYVRRAKGKLRGISAVKIAVTGSFGKTGVKQILSQLLPDCVATCGSYNTPLGIARFVNSTNFSAARYAVFEMGARRRGDVAQLCKLVQPTVGVLTGIAPQHLATFGSLANVIAAKCELPQFLPEEGLIAIGQNDLALSNAMSVGKCKKVTFSDFSVSEVTAKGSKFSFCACDGKRYDVTIPLLGVAHCLNCALAINLCVALGLSGDETAAKCAFLRQVSHRMEVSQAGELTIIDDGYNANSEGVRRCAETLAMLSGFKIAVLQGIVEVGKESAKLNYTAGKTLGEVCDVAIVCGVNSKYLKSGAKETRAKVFEAENLAHAVEIAKKYYRDGAILLFQNDLPDGIK